VSLMTTPHLIPLDEACQLFSISIRTGRRMVRTGQLPATKPGREYLVSADDMAALLRPTLRPATSRAGRESPTARAERQLREAGIAT